MANLPAGSVLVIGIGNAYRSDDAVGLVVVRRLKEQTQGSVQILEHGGEGADLMESWRDARAVILVDAAHSGARPGTIHRIDCRHQPLPHSMFGDSTHAFGVAEAVELSRVLGRLPPRLVMFGIEGESYKLGTELSPAVRLAMSQVVDTVLEEINK
ncbi:MAG: hydrogenase maturation protease [Acidobacteria bacterium]|nr:hydrogenase maturation protease [Acidobacteriota bacterium]